MEAQQDLQSEIAGLLYSALDYCDEKHKNLLNDRIEAEALELIEDYDITDVEELYRYASESNIGYQLELKDGRLLYHYFTAYGGPTWYISVVLNPFGFDEISHVDFEESTPDGQRYARTYTFTLTAWGVFCALEAARTFLMVTDLKDIRDNIHIE